MTLRALVRDVPMTTNETIDDTVEFEEISRCVQGKSNEFM